MHVDDDTGKTIGQYGQTTIQGRKATFHTTCVAQRLEDQLLVKGKLCEQESCKTKRLRKTALPFDYDNLDGQ